MDFLLERVKKPTNRPNSPERKAFKFFLGFIFLTESEMKKSYEAHQISRNKWQRKTIWKFEPTDAFKLIPILAVIYVVVRCLIR